MPVGVPTSNTNYGGGSATSLALDPFPAHVAGDLLVVAVHWKTGNGTATADGITCTAGWTADPNVAEYLTSPRQYIKLFWKIAGSNSEPAPTISFSGGTTGNAGHVFLFVKLKFSGADTTNPIGTAGTTYTSSPVTSTTVGPIPSPGTVGNGDMVLVVSGLGDDDSYDVATVNSPYAMANATRSSLGSDGGIAAAYVAGSGTDPGSATFTHASILAARIGRSWTIRQPGSGGGPAAAPSVLRRRRAHTGLYMRGR